MVLKMIFGCGNNISNQIIKDGPQILCCPTQVNIPEEVEEVHIAFSHLLWRIGTEWKHTGYVSNNSPSYANLYSSWKVTVSENRTVAINESGSIVIWDKRKFWRKLVFQNSCLKNEYISDSLNEDHRERCSHSISEVGDSKYANRKKDKEISHDLEIFPEDKCSISGIEPECEQPVNESNQVFEKLCIEDNAMLALDKDGVVYNCDTPVSVCRQQISQICLGKDHFMALTSDGSVYTWGSGMRGQLGNGELANYDNPVLVEHLEGLNIISISCGGWHSVALSNSGDAYVWGWNESGQLGFPFKNQTGTSFSQTLAHDCKCLIPVCSKSLDRLCVKSLVQDKALHSISLSSSEIEIEGVLKSDEEGGTSKCAKLKTKTKCAELERTYECAERKRTYKSGEEKRTSHSAEEQRTSNCAEEKRTSKGAKEEGTLKRAKEEVTPKSAKEEKPSKSTKEELTLKTAKEEKHREYKEDERINKEREEESLNVQASPKLLNYWNENISIVAVACGDRHSLFQLDDGSVWAVGMNKYGQLGLGHTKVVSEACEVPIKNVNRFFAGGWNSIFVTSHQ